MCLCASAAAFVHFRKAIARRCKSHLPADHAADSRARILFLTDVRHLALIDGRVCTHQHTRPHTHMHRLSISSHESAASHVSSSPMSHRRTPPADSLLRRPLGHPQSYTSHTSYAGQEGACGVDGGDVYGVFRQDVAGHPVQVILDLTLDDTHAINPFSTSHGRSVRVICA
jgi:hypothetical protein